MLREIIAYCFSYLRPCVSTTSLLSPGARTRSAPTDIYGSSKHLPSASPLIPSPTLGQHHPSSHSPGASVGAASALDQHHSSPLSPAAHDQPLTQVNSPPIGHSQALNRSPLSPAAHGQPPNHTPLSSATHGQPGSTYCFFCSSCPQV